MALTFASPFPQTIKTNAVLVSAANNNRAAPSTVVEILTAGPDGGLLTRLEFLPTSDTVASEIQIFSSTDGGTTRRLVRSLLLPQLTASLSTARPTIKADDISENVPFYLQGSEKVFIGLGTAQTSAIVARASWGDY